MKVKLLVLAVLALLAITSQADEQFPVIKANGQVYSNATVVKVTATDIIFVSDQGTANAKLKDLDTELQEHFGYTNTALPAVIERKSAGVKTQFLNFTPPKAFQAEQAKLMTHTNPRDMLI